MPNAWVEKSGPADYAGLRDGDKIMEINDTNVAEMDYEDVMKIINEVEGNEIKPGFQTAFSLSYWLILWLSATVS